MRAIVQRELRRLAPYGLLGPAAFLIVILGLVVKDDEWSQLFFAGLFVGPAILGLATVVPDTASGGTTFFARMPISAGRVLWSKFAASLVYLTLATGVSYVTIALAFQLRTTLHGAVREVDLPVSLWAFPLVVQAFSYGAGLLASIVASRVMPAILLTPAVAAIGALLAGLTPAALFRVQPAGDPTFGLLTGLTLAAAFLTASYLAYTRGQRHLKTPRPLLLASAVLAPTLLVWVGGVGVVQAWTAEAAVDDLQVIPETAQASGVTAVPLEGLMWSGKESRVVVLGSEGGSWIVPERWVRYPALSPNGKHLLVSSIWERGGFLIDLTSKRVTPVPNGRSKEGFGFRYTLWRSNGTPLLIEVRDSRVVCFDPIENEMQLSDLPRSIRGVAGVTPKQELVVWDSKGIYGLPNLVDWPAPPSGSRLQAQVKNQPTTWKVDRQKLGKTLQLDTWQSLEASVADFTGPDAPAPPAAGAHFAEVILSPTGRYAVCRSQRQKTPLEIYDLHEHERVLNGRIVAPLLVKAIEQGQASGPKAGGLGSRRFGSYVFGFGPEDRLLVVERWRGHAAVIDLATGASRRFDVPRPSSLGYPAVWSGDGSQVVLPSGVQIRVASETGTRAGSPRVSVLPETATPLAAWSAQGPIRIARLSPSQLQRSSSEGGAE